MLGATLFRGHAGNLPAGAIFSIRAAAPSVVYLVVEEARQGGMPGRSGGLLPKALEDAQWERRADAPSLSSSGSKMAVFARRIAAREALSSPEIREGGAMVTLVVKVDVEAFDASIQTNKGLEYGRTLMCETAVAWSDCANIWTWVPAYTKDGILFRGPHDSTPQGTKIRITATGAFRAYVIVEAQYKGGEARHGGFLQSLPAQCWQIENAPPSWGDNNSTMRVFSKFTPEGQDLELPITKGQVVFSIVVMSTAASTDLMAEELKKVFKAWDSDHKGGIAKNDLEVLLSVVCPTLQKSGMDALLTSLDKAKRGVFNYEDVINKVMLMV